ncbi:dynein heavy chain 2, axonemal-like isoform X2 [Photinus pyralis]|uniref:dynein heavy chain 2, axonemal-like isoform X2 n=1 Tax=Photinus pyralis TaxID=7054 RepID=UPI0012671F27|nr:dynein heavy chain 2, axonemal-like isoform X2 [Photinus pyralis]
MDEKGGKVEADTQIEVQPEREEKDSLFSDEDEEEKVVEVTTPVEAEEVITAEYAEEVMAKLVRIVKDLTMLYDLRESDWTEDTEKAIQEFFTDLTIPILVVYFDHDTLIVSKTFPTCCIVDLMYFIRGPNEKFELSTIHDCIMFGNAHRDVEGTILNILESIYAPILFSVTTWPDSVKNDICTATYNFLQTVTDLHHRLYGLTVIYIPQECVNVSVVQASKDKELIKRLEGVVVYWTRQIRVCLQDQDQNTPQDLLCPIDEYEFWVYRHENLSGLSYQMKNPNLMHVCDILSYVQSTHVTQFMILIEDIHHSLREAKSNIEYLQVITQPCADLMEKQSPAEIPRNLVEILNLFRFIWEQSPFYNSRRKITALCRALSNQIILQCKKFTNLDVVFKEKHSRAAIIMFQTCIDCCVEYTRIYTAVSETHIKYSQTHWNLDKAPIFNHIDTFIQRCKDMIEICEAMITFGRFDEKESIPIPRLGGTRGVEFETWCVRIENMFQESLNYIEEQRETILDVQDSSWNDKILKFRARMEVIETVIENLVNAIFKEVVTVEDGIEALAALYNYSTRKSLKNVFDFQTRFIYSLFLGEINDCKQELVKQNEEYPAQFPYYAGRAMIASLKRNRLEILKKTVENASWLRDCSIAEDTWAQYAHVLVSIENIIRNLYQKWITSVGTESNERLNRSLMKRSTSKMGLLECNIDRSLLELLHEAKYWEALKFELPGYLGSICQKGNQLKLIFEKVLAVVMDYNKIIASLSGEERLLFRQLINDVEKKIVPGLSKLTWATDVGDAYVAECCTATAELQDFLDDYKTCNLQIVQVCERICGTSLIQLEENHAYDLIELIHYLGKYRNDIIDKLIEDYREIIQYLIVVYEGFESRIQLMGEEWIKYVLNFDRLIEEALTVCVKNSLLVMYEALHGDGSTLPSPILKLEANLKRNRINFEPSLADVGYVISDTLPSITNTLKSLPRLADKFGIQVASLRPFHKIISEDQECQKLQNLLNEEVTVNVRHMHTYLAIWEPFRDMWEVDKERFMARYEQQKPSAAQFDSNIGRYTEVANNVQIQESVSNVHFIVVNSVELKKSIIDHCIDWQNNLCALLHKLTVEKVRHVYAYIHTNSEVVMRQPRNLEEMADALIFFNTVVAEAEFFSDQFPSITDQIITLDKYKVDVGDEIRNLEKGLPATWVKYLETLEASEKLLSYTKDELKGGLLENAEKLRHDCAGLMDEFLHSGPFSATVNAKDALAYLANVKDSINGIRQKEEELRRDLKIFDLSLPESLELQALETELATIELVWQLTDDWDTAWNGWKSGGFWDIRTEDMEDIAQTLFRKLTRLSRELKERNWDIVDHTRARVDAFRRTLPLISDLKNPAMRERHWDRVRAAINRDFDENSPEFNLEAIIAMDMQIYSDEINEISNAATMELQIEKGLENIKSLWDAMFFEMVPHKEGGVFRIKSVEECFQALEENMMQLSTMKSTRYVEPFAKDVDYWERTLSYIMETVEVALVVQRQWLYLENIFGGEDIRKQLPKESNDFEKLTRDWIEITRSMYQSGTALRATHIQPPPSLLNRLNGMNDQLELIQRALERYLETKRHIFPRFYFISNDDMLEILGNSKKPESIQPHFKKLFDNINKIKIQKNSILNKIESIGMISEDGEYMEYTKSVLLDGPVEFWLCDIETAMRGVLRAQFKPCRTDLKKNLNTRDKWLLSNCGQLCNACSQIQWTTDCTRALVHCKIMENKKPLKKLRKKQNQVLGKLSELSRRELPKIQRLKTNALITIEIHSRDVIDRMYKANCRDVGDFEWFSQLRFYWDRELDDCLIRQTNTHFMYGYEYNGNSGRLVITPLTDRCYITLTTALHLFRGGSPKGPAGTGKTETVKDLGKAMGMWVIVNNCSEGLDYKSMGKCFSGLAQTGAWGCFDEFNRINIEVLSVVAQQILSILQAISQTQTSLVFEGIEIKLKRTCGIFITMNPGYAGRTELPDNLKSMFRPISMMVPDNLIIAENTLFSDGFQNTKLLAKKVFTLYQLAQRQLSKQDHYDFGLRSMVALLRYAGRKRRVHSDFPEEQVVYLAMADMNIAKFTSDDLPLFNGIMSDIFPGVSVPVVDYEEMNNAIRTEFTLMGLQSIKKGMVKVIQLYETKNSRHSTMILGKTGTAKSATWKCLKASLIRLRKAGKPGFNLVQEYPINPKALSQGELYGEYNLQTNEWLDGVISAMMRQTCSEETPDEKWILFDGPVDAVWIENMNSVMDDNKVLTLINSDRITMPEQVSLLFEVADLSVASPATVSRCGMVYNDYKDWGWQPYVMSWIQKQEKRGKLFQDLMKTYFNNYLGMALDFKRLHCKETVICSELNLVGSLCRLLEVFATSDNGVDPKNEDTFEEIAKLWFMFCLVWSVCATVNEDGRRKLDAYIREKEGIFPLKDTVYEYFVDVRKKCFSSWEEKLSDNWRYSPGSPFFKIIVPTVDTVRYRCIVETLLAAGYPSLLTGPVGTGKTSTAQSVLSSLDLTRFSVLNVNLSAQTSSINVQDIIESRLEKRTKTTFVPAGNKIMVTFFDDFNMPAKETYGSQPPLELLRQWIDYGFWYDRLKQTRKYVQNMLLMAGMGPPGGGRQNISERTLSRFNVINMTFPSESQIIRIFGTMLLQHLSNFPEEVKVAGQEITFATVDLYNNVIEKMLPTPAKMHYLFNLRDISKIFQGLLRSHKDYQNTKNTILRLWIHESFRVFFDRLIDDKDREWFFAQINDQLGAHFDQTLHSLCTNKAIPIFGGFINPFGIYEDLLDYSILRNYIETQMGEYNVSPGVIRMDLVLFRDAIEHICRIVRVISQPRGNMLLVGIGGSGRQSLSRISSYICELNTFQITVTKNYKVVEFREDLKTLYSATGVDTKPTTFLFNDTQVTDEQFLEIINNMLSSGEVSNLYKPDEFEDVKNKLTGPATKAGVLPTSESLYNFLIERVRENLHIILCMSPIGNAFRVRLRQYPSLVNCSTIDWFCDWPKEALLEVAQKYIGNVNFVATITGETLEKRKESVLLCSQDRLKQSVAFAFATIHDSVARCSKRMAEEMKRRNYVTPTNYLELVAGYKIMLSDKRAEIASQANKLRNGLWKIDDCRSKVEVMSQELEVAQVKVAEFQQQCDDYLVIIVAQRKEADEQAKEVAITSIKIGEAEVQCKKLADLAQADLDEAMPALEEAVQALDALNKKDITEMKSYGKPPVKVEMVMEAVMILKQLDPSWAEAKKQLGDQNFLTNLREFDKNNISEKTLKKIATYTSNEEFVPDKIGIVSLAAKSLCMWVIAIEKYAKVWKIVAPKKARLDEALESLKQQQKLLAAAHAKLAELNMMLARLQREYEEKLLQKEELNKKAEFLRLKLERAAMLVENLAGERERWDSTVFTLDTQFVYLPGDCLLATAFISYLGPFVSQYRDGLVEFWKDQVMELEIAFDSEFNVSKFLCDPTTIREWNIQGLPSHAFSTENGIIVTRGTRWPLVIDPQIQAQKWIKAMERKNGLKTIDFGMTDYMKVLEAAIQNGKPVILQNILEEMDPSLNPVLNKDIIKQGGTEYIKFDEKLITYNRNFKFFITTKLTNPHYPPEISTKTTLVNFAVKQQGLEAQLLGVVIRKERPQLEEQKDKMVTTIAQGKRTLINLENELLRLLNESKGSLLENAELFNTLQVSKATSMAVQKSLEVSEVTEIQIDIAREGYRPCAERASILFFVLSDMGKIDPMYQFALDSYILLFAQSIDKSTKSNHLPDRIANLNDYHTYAVYKNTCRTLFERHKLLFSFHMCIKILEAQEKIMVNEYNFLLKGGVVLDRENQPDNPCTWLNEESWDNITELDKLPGFHGTVASFEQFTKDWREWYINTEPETLPLIGEWDDICDEFQKMLFVRCIRQDRISFCTSNFIINQLGPKFVEPPVLDVKAVFEESLPQTPLIFVLSPGVDPTNALITLADSMSMNEHFQSLSLGQGQAPIATRMIATGTKTGDWVFLANCHLSLSWMPKLDKIVENLQTTKVHPNFRLWLSSSPHPDFPLSILQAGIKMTTEPPKGIKANLKRLYQIITEDQFNLCQAREKYKRLLFSLCFFHAILLERKKFQQLGWNVIYSFNDADFEVSENLLSIYLDEYPVTPWDALKYLIAGVNYGGHVTDDWDRRLLLTYINQFFCEEALTNPYHRLSSLPTYYIPRDGSLESYLNYVNVLPNTDRPETFGQHPNADIASLNSETRSMCETLMSLQIQTSSGTAELKEEKVSQMAADVLCKIPSPIDYETTDKLIGAHKTPLDVVLLQEIQRYNALLIGIRVSLNDLQKGIKGLVVMSSELEDIFVCIDEGRVPSPWLKTYPSLKLLGSWTRDLVLRVDHFSQWAETIKPPMFFWLSAYTFPTGFLTACLQAAARTMEVPIDMLGWEFTVQTVEEYAIVEKPSSGVYIKGLYLEGGGWDKKTSTLIEPQPMQLVCAMPLIHFKPTEQLKKRTRGLYQCPAYYYPIRTGMQGWPAFIVAVDLKCSSEGSHYWVKRGTALLLSLSN